jgi:hypothetical protein
MVIVQYGGSGAAENAELFDLVTDRTVAIKLLINQGLLQP